MDTKAIDRILSWKLESRMDVVLPVITREDFMQAAAELAELKAENLSLLQQKTSLSEENSRLWNDVYRWAQERDNPNATIHQLRAELADKERELEEWENAKKFVADGCKDEQHCGCVPILKRELDEARELLKEIHDCGGHMYEHSAPYRVYDKLDAWLSSHPKDGEK
jgi:hypothetical protein